ncbi:RNA methyltransferase [Rhodobacteraceae bacterium RKSG542]|uniref:TrmH family RNA methyltransferase n=1 Tax=Pseudovibrio flavus TaxID=2529854 RepID=UPI0012BD2596|nr:RNA methyltransferase [Pseudovibrio flavus]MTI19391.1 RNA methyltransferase [Pseudovibrio flavus]
MTENKRPQNRSFKDGTSRPARTDKRSPYAKDKRAAGKGKPPFRSHEKPEQEGPYYIYGLHTLEAAFRNTARKRHKLVVTQNALARLEERGITIDVPVEMATPRQIDKMVPRDAVHQGAILLVDPLPEYGAYALRDGNLVLALDQVTDPHNVGAIMRSAVAMCADAVVTTRRHAPEEGPVLAKTASGALDMIKHVRVTNMARFIEEMIEEGFQAIALDSEGPATLEDTVFTDKTLLILGSEGKGVRQGVREKCSTLARLDMPGKIKSLNVSNAAMLSLYVSRQKMGLN